MKLDLELFKFSAPKMALEIVCVFPVSQQQFCNRAYALTVALLIRFVEQRTRHDSCVNRTFSNS
jgi:hypothetical protein